MNTDGSGCLCSSFARWVYRRVYFEFGDQEHVQHAEALVRLVDNDRAARLRPGEKLWMVDAERTAIPHMDGEGPKWLRTVHVF